MRAALFLIPILIVLILSSCSSEQDKINQLKVCNCEDLMVILREQKSMYTIVEKMTPEDAQAKVDEDFKGQIYNCTKVREDLGEDTYFKYSQECGGK